MPGCRLISIFKSLVAGLGAISLVGCAELSSTSFPVTAEDQTEIIQDNFNIIHLTPQNIGYYTSPISLRHSGAALPQAASEWQYLVGIGDILSITVWDHPELTLPAGPERGQIEHGSLVNVRGEIFYPYINQLRVAGRTVNYIQSELTRKLSEFVSDPQVEVKVMAFNSQKVIVTGAIARPGAIMISNTPLTLIDAINNSGGLISEADSSHVTVQRNGQTYYIHLQAFLSNGRGGGNPILQGGDIVNIPGHEKGVAYVMGEVEQPGAIDLGRDGVNLTEAITLSGGLSRATADAQGIFVFRAQTGTQGFDVFQLDATTPLAFALATQFTLHRQDVIYVVASPTAQWNAVIAMLLPSIGVARGVQVIRGGL